MPCCDPLSRAETRRESGWDSRAFEHLGPAPKPTEVDKSPPDFGGLWTGPLDPAVKDLIAGRRAPQGQHGGRSRRRMWSSIKSGAARMGRSRSVLSEGGIL